MSPASRYEKMNQWWGNAGPALQNLDNDNEYAYLFIRAHQPLKYQREEDNLKVLIANQQIIG